MLDNKMLFEAIGLADDDFIEEGRKALRYGAGTKMISLGRVWKVALIAAVIAALLAVTGFATEWFGLSARTNPASEPAQTIEGKKSRNFISMNGYANSPEALAHAEWIEYWNDYVLSHEFSNETDTSWTANEQEESYYYIYSAFNREMMDKLLEIQAKYGIRLHTQQAHPQLPDMIYKTTGAEPFFTCDESFFTAKMVYEDSSFSGDGYVILDGIECWFSLVRGAQGVLDPSGASVLEAENYTEWQYANENGDTVNLATNFISPDDETIYMYLFAQQGDYIITIFGSCPIEGDPLANAERFADCFDLEALCAKDSDLRPILNTKPTNVKPKEGLMTLKEFVETPEYKAASDFYDFFGEYCDSLPENDFCVDGMDGYRYYGDFPSGIDIVNTELHRIIDEYDLVSPGKGLCYWAGAKILPADRGVHSGERPHADRSHEVSEEDYYEAMGFGSFSKDDSWPFHMIKYDNGAIWLNEVFGTGCYDLHYIPKGCFHPLLMTFHSSEAAGWAYESVCGEQVWISIAEQAPYPKWPKSSILYETDTAYVLVIKYDCIPEAYLLEAIADNIDFTMFN